MNPSDTSTGTQAAMPARATEPDRPCPAGATATAQVERPVNISSEALFTGGATEVRIAHRGAVYRLKQTALGKLILTK